VILQDLFSHKEETAWLKSFERRAASNHFCNKEIVLVPNIVRGVLVNTVFLKYLHESPMRLILGRNFSSLSHFVFILLSASLD